MSSFVLSIFCVVALVVLLIVDNERQQQKNIALEDYNGQKITEAWNLRESSLKPERYYNISSMVFVERTKIRDTEKLQKVINKISKTKSIDFVEPLAGISIIDIQLSDGEKVYFNINYGGYMTALYDPKSANTYEIDLESFEILNSLFIDMNNEFNIWRFIIFSAIFLSAVHAIFYLIRKFTKREETKSNEKNTLVDILMNVAAVSSIAFAPAIYGAYNIGWIAAILLLILCIGGFIKKEANIILNFSLVLMIVIFLYGDKWIQTI